MKATAYLIAAIGCLATVYAAGVFVAARFEFRSARAATLANRIGLLAGFLAVAIALGWAVRDLGVPLMEMIASAIGDGWMLAGLIGVGIAATCWLQKRKSAA